MTDHLHTFSRFPFADPVNSLAYCTTLVVHAHLPVLQVAHDDDGAWQFLDATTDDIGEPVLMCLGCVFERDATLSEIADLPRGWGAYREYVGAAWERWQKAPAEDEADEQADGKDAESGDAKALADIEEYGLHIISVTGDGDAPPFCYSIGIGKSLGMPELIVIGIKPALATSMINACYRQMATGVPFTPGARVADLIEGFDCEIGDVAPAHYRRYMGWALWLYEGSSFRALQIIYPDMEGVFPWEPQAHQDFRDWQPLLAVSAAA